MTKESEIGEIERLYSLICSRALSVEVPDGLQQSVIAVSGLEELTHSDFLSTEDMHIKVQSFLDNKRKPHTRLKELRKSKGYRVMTMAGILGITKRHYIRMEKGQVRLNKKALEVIRGGA